ncbi:MAG: glutaredoxin domain-containing protein [Propionicimonas sp.]
MHARPEFAGRVETKPARWYEQELPEGAYAKIPAWRSATQWIDALTVALTSENGQRIRKALGPAEATVLRVARADAASATRETGRGVQTSHGRLAAALGVSEDTVRLCRRVIRRLGFAAIPEGGHGRQLGEDERTEALAATGRRVYRIASTRALTVPREHASSPPSTPSGVGPLSSVRRTHQARPQRARCTTSTKNTPARSRPGRRTQHVSAELLLLLPYLDEPSRHLGQINAVVDAAFAPFGGLDALPTCPDRDPDPEDPNDKGFTAAAWVAEVLKNAIDGWHTTHQRAALAMNARDRLAGFAWGLKQALDSPTISRLRAGLEYAARRAARPTTTERTTTMTSNDTLIADPPATLTVYSTPNCQMCKATYRALDNRGVRYDVVDLTQHDDLRDTFKELGHLQAPVVVTPDGEHWSAYRPDRISALAARTAALAS